MPVPDSTARRLWRGRYVVVYVALAASFVAHLRVFYHPPTGFSSLIWFGNWFAQWRLARLGDVPIYTMDRDGYDGQFYAQVAVAGNPLDPELRVALDSPGYRARRVLVPLLAHAVGLGRPAAVLTCYAFANVLAWLVLAYLLARWWLPPRDLHNLIRWAGVLFGVGMMVSVARSLADGPALLLVACAARAAERRRHLFAALLMAAAGLTRETSVLAAGGLMPERGGAGRRPWLRAAGLLAICALPTVLWMLYLRARFDYLGGERGFGLPLAGLVVKLREIREGLRTQGYRAWQELFAVIAVAVQVGFIAARPRPRELWWRIGAPFALLAVFLGSAVWEGFLSAAPRAILPLTLAFNMLVPRTRAGLALLLAGNLTVLSVADAYRPLRPNRDGTFAGGITVTYDPHWHERESLQTTHWRWVNGSAELRVRNPATTDRVVTFDFELGSVTARVVDVRGGGVERHVVLQPGTKVPVQLAPVVLHPGITIVTFTTDAPPWYEPTPGGRPLAFSVHDLSVR